MVFFIENHILLPKSSKRMNTNSTSSEENSGHLDSSNLLVFFFRKWKTIAIVCLLAAVLGAIASFMIKEKFQSSAVLFATPQQSFGEQIFEKVKKNDLLEFGEKEDAERLLQIINSVPVMNKVVEKFNLWEKYELVKGQPGSVGNMILQYNENVEAKLTKFGAIRISVLDDDNVLARDITNYIVSVSDSATINLKSKRAQIAFEYTKITYDELLVEIQIMEDSVTALRKMGVYSYYQQIIGLNEQYATALMEGRAKQAAEIKGIMDEISIYGADFNNIMRRIEGAQAQAQIIKARYSLLEMDVKASISSMYVVNWATVSDKKAYPIRWLIVAMTVLGTFVLTVVLLMVIESYKKLQKEDLN